MKVAGTEIVATAERPVSSCGDVAVFEALRALIAELMVVHGEEIDVTDWDLDRSRKVVSVTVTVGCETQRGASI